MVEIKVTLFKFFTKFVRKYVLIFHYHVTKLSRISLVRLNFIEDRKRTGIFRLCLFYKTHTPVIVVRCHIKRYLKNKQLKKKHILWDVSRFEKKYDLTLTLLWGVLLIDFMLSLIKRGRHLKLIIWMWCDCLNNE